jgi:hypothetical protein
MSGKRTPSVVDPPGAERAEREAKRCFVAMPFNRFDDLYTKAIKPAVEACFGNGSCSRGDTRRTAQVVGDRLAEEIILADVVIGVITDNNPNVMYEIGIAHALRKPTLLMRDRSSTTPAPFDVAPHETIAYEAAQYAAIQRTLKEYLQGIRDDPRYEASNLLTRAIGHKYFPYVDDFRGLERWLLGYVDVLRVESRARTVWEINPDTHWLKQDPSFRERIQSSIRESNRRHYYMIPDEPKTVRRMKDAFNAIARELEADSAMHLPAYLKYVTVEPAFFELMPFSIAIYNAMTLGEEAVAILLEPMANEIGTDKFDKNVGDLHRWQETTFDVRIGDRDIVSSLTTTFREHWNRAIERECESAGSEQERQALRTTWLI